MKPSTTITAFDFRGKRVKARRQNGTWEVQDKFSLGYMLKAIDCIRYDACFIYNEAFKYNELKTMLISALEKHPEYGYEIIK